MAHYDAIVIGSGQGGNPLCYGLADRGWKVALVEKADLGGCCVNVGCTPTKTMVHCAQVAHYARDAARWGVNASDVSVDLPKVVELKRDIVTRFRGGHEKKVADRPTLDLFRGHGRFLDAGTVRVGDATLESSKIFINTGTRPLIPSIPGIDDTGYLTNETVMELEELPAHLIVLGGGYVGLEFGQIYRRFGCQVTVIHRGDRLLTREDADVAAELQRALEAEGMEFRLNAKASKARRRNDIVELDVECDGKSETIAGTHLLIATGRVPNTDDLGLERAGVDLDPRGFVKVSDRLETSVPGIWAIGDVKGGPAFTHISWNDYQIIRTNLIEGGDASIAGRQVPYCAFTDPQLGRVGMTEAEARAGGRPLKVGKIPMTWVARALERNETAGLMKVVVDAETDRILGAATLCTEGGEIIQILGFMMRAEAPYTMLKGAIYIHPTLAEGFYALMDAVTPLEG